MCPTQKNLVDRLEPITFLKDADAIYQHGHNYDSDSTDEDKSKKIKWITIAAKKGHAAAQYELGLNSLDEGEYKEAFNWIKKAAETDHDAQYTLGWMYLNGVGIPASPKIAFGWYEKSAYARNSYAQYAVGWMYCHGVGVEQSDILARQWFERAATLGNVMAQYELGTMILKDYDPNYPDEDILHDALYWFKKAADQNKLDADEKVRMIEQILERSSEY